MKHLMMVVVAILFVASMTYAQKQPLPTFTGGIQGQHAAMLYGPHDFTPDSGRSPTTDSIGGPSKNLCRYCHAAHVPATGIARPLWVRASRAGNTFGSYSNPTSLDVTVPDAGSGDNYSSFCMSCHDGSAIFTKAAYTEGSRPYLPAGDAGWVPYETQTVSPAANMYNGEFNLEHVHPVNFDYAAAQALDPQGIYAAGGTNYVVQVASAASGSLIAGTSTVRLFDGKMQCSSCHMPHMKSGIGMAVSTDYGKLCVSCHRK